MPDVRTPSHVLTDDGRLDTLPSGRASLVVVDHVDAHRLARVGGRYLRCGRTVDV